MKADNEMKDSPAVSHLCAFLREGHIDPALLFASISVKPFVRGDVIYVNRTTHNREHKRSVVLQTRLDQDQVTYVTEHGGPYDHHYCEMRERATSKTLAWADPVADVAEEVDSFESLQLKIAAIAKDVFRPPVASTVLGGYEAMRTVSRTSPKAMRVFLKTINEDTGASLLYTDVCYMRFNDLVRHVHSFVQHKGV